MSRPVALLLLVACGPRVDPADTSDDTPIDTEPDIILDTDTDTDADADADADADTDTDTDADTDTVPTTTIYDVQDGTVATGATVTLSGVRVAAAPTANGFWIAEPSGGKYSGLWVFFDRATVSVSVAAGDEIALSGRILEYTTGSDAITQLLLADSADLTVLSRGNALPAPVSVTTTTLASGATAEPYEGVLVKVTNPQVTNPDLGYGEWEIDGQARVDDQLTAFGPLQTGDTFTSITGILNYGFDWFKLEPRDAADFVGYTPAPPSDCTTADRCVDDLGAGDLVITELMFNPNGGGAYLDDANEWVEIYNASGGSVDLNGLVMKDASGNTGGPSVSTVVAARGYAVLGAADGSGWGYTAFTCDAWYGSEPKLGNSGDALSLENTAGVIDAVVAYARDQTAAGVAWQLSGSKIDATSNDTATNLCAATTPIGSSGDAGTPGAANATCP